MLSSSVGAARREARRTPIRILTFSAMCDRQPSVFSERAHDALRDRVCPEPLFASLRGWSQRGSAGALVRGWNGVGDPVVRRLRTHRRRGKCGQMRRPSDYLAGVAVA